MYGAYKNTTRKNPLDDASTRQHVQRVKAFKAFCRENKGKFKNRRERFAAFLAATETKKSQKEV